jgi:hypothetical protein
VPQFGHMTPQRVCDSCAYHLSKGDTECFAKLIPYLEVGQPEAERAAKEALELLIKHERDGGFDDVLGTNCLLNVISLLTASSGRYHY